MRNVCGDEYQPTVDGTFLPDFPENLFKLDYLHKAIDVIYGFNSDEGAMFIYGLNGFQLIRNRQEAERILDQLVDKMFFRGSAKCEQIKQVLRREYLSDGDLSRRSFLIVQPQLKQEEVSQRSYPSSARTPAAITHSNNDHVLYVLYHQNHFTLLTVDQMNYELCFLFQYSYETQI